MKKMIGLAALFLIGISAIAQQAGMAKADLAAEEMAIRDISKQWLSMERSKDFDGIGSLFADDGVMYRPNHEPLIGPEAVRRYYSEQDKNSSVEEVNWSTERVEISSSGDMAIEFGKYNSSLTGAGGSDKGTFVTVYRKENGKWKVIADIANSSSIPAEKPMQ